MALSEVTRFQCAFKTANADILVLDSHSERAVVWHSEIKLEAITKVQKKKVEGKKKLLVSEGIRKTGIGFRGK